VGMIAVCPLAVGAGEDEIVEDMIFAAGDSLEPSDGSTIGRLVPHTIGSLTGTCRWMDMRMETAARNAC
jgi:hypothetical protein